MSAQNRNMPVAAAFWAFLKCPEIRGWSRMYFTRTKGGLMYEASVGGAKAIHSFEDGQITSVLRVNPNFRPYPIQHECRGRKFFGVQRPSSITEFPSPNSLCIV